MAWRLVESLPVRATLIHTNGRNQKMSKNQIIALGAAAMLAVSAQAAQAHVGVSHTSGFAHGFAHPIGGLDHILAMILVGILAAQIGGRAMWLVPASFVAVMVLGGIVGTSGIGLPFVELGIGLSVVVLGAVVALGVRMAVMLAMALVGFFAMFHGFAHGAEMPATSAGIDYGVGFVAATAVLHAIGVGFGLTVARWAAGKGKGLVQATGGAAALAGAALVTGAF
jgi:urease accessory protein